MNESERLGELQAHIDSFTGTYQNVNFGELKEQDALTPVDKTTQLVKHHSNHKDDLIKELIDLKLNQRFTQVDLHNYLIEKYQYKTSQRYSYIKAMQEYISKIYQADTQAHLDDLIVKLETLFKTTKSDLIKIECLKYIGKIRGLETKKVDITSGGEQIKININILNASKY